MTISELLAKAREKLQKNSTDYLGIELIAAHCFNKSREQLITDSLQEVTPQQEDIFRSFFERFYVGEPVAYLLNKKEFYGLDFFVDKRVLIPRPETEMLVDEVISTVGHLADKPRILDIGTGSGCIAVAIAKHCPHAQITAVDVSEEALEVASQNIKNHQLQKQIQLKKSDLLTSVEEPYDIVVANLPYIGKEKFNFVSREAEKYEPNVALFGGKDGLTLYQKLFEQLKGKSWKPKLLLGEFGFLQGEEIRKLLQQFYNDKDWTIRNDLASIERMFVVSCDGTLPLLHV